MKITTASKNDVKEIFSLQKKAFEPVAKKINCYDIPQMKDTLDDVINTFNKTTTLKMLSDNGDIIGSINGQINDGVLHIGRLMVDPDYQHKGLGKMLLHHLENMMPHTSEELCSYIDDDVTCTFYSKEGFKECYRYTVCGDTMAMHMEKNQLK